MIMIQRQVKSVLRRSLAAVVTVLLQFLEILLQCRNPLGEIDQRNDRVSASIVGHTYLWRVTLKLGSLRCAASRRKDGIVHRGVLYLNIGTRRRLRFSTMVVHTDLWKTIGGWVRSPESRFAVTPVIGVISD